MMARYGYGGFAPYVPVAERRKKAEKKVAALQKKGRSISPVHIAGRVIAKTFWGKAWCDNLESYSDYSNRMPRGRTYVRNGSVLDLQMTPGEITALVNGSSIYEVKIKILPLEPTLWKTIISQCAGQIDSLLELLQGKFSTGVMEIITHKKSGLFPSPEQISMSCSCPDYATMCKHVAATLYGVGARLDESPEHFFRLRRVDQSDLIAAAATGSSSGIMSSSKSGKALQTKDLSSLFGIDLDEEQSSKTKTNANVNKKTKAPVKAKGKPTKKQPSLKK